MALTAPDKGQSPAELRDKYVGRASQVSRVQLKQILVEQGL